MNKPIVTLITDFGISDYYSASIKGPILAKNPSTHLVDITHNVKSYDIVQASYILKNTYLYFPKGTIHLISVNNFYAQEYCFLVLKYKEHYFIAPDNGLFSLTFNKTDFEQIYELDIPQEVDNPLGEMYAKTVHHIAEGMAFNEIGIEIESIEHRISFQPVTTKDQIRGAVVYIDTYENAITNISKELIERIGKGRKYKVLVKRHEPIEKISNSYSEVPIGEIMALINSSDNLEIAINMGKAASLLGIHIDENVQIDFYD